MLRQIFRYVVILSVLCAVIGVAAWWGWHEWAKAQSAVAVKSPPSAQGSASTSIPVRLSPQARANLKLITKPLKPTTYWRTVEFPGVIVDRPGITDRGVVAPVTGVVTKVHAFPGDAVDPLAPLFTLRLQSDSLYDSQLEIFKATKDMELARNRLERLSSAALSGAVAGARVIEIEDQIERFSATVQAYRQDLKARGLPDNQIEAAEAGKFVTEIVVRAPSEHEQQSADVVLTAAESNGDIAPFTFEVQSLGVELGAQVSAGQVLCHLADHRALLIEARGFNNDMSHVQEAVKNGWGVEVVLQDAVEGDWPGLPEKFPIDHVANVIDPESRTFAFYVPLQNQWQTYSRDGKVRLLWRFRPGGQLRVRVPVEKFENVYVVPQAAIVREGPEAFIFRQNGEFFDRRPIELLYEDRLNAVVAADKSARSGFYIAQNGAASLNRIMKSQASSGVPAGVHVHPDGTVHAEH
jgi:cobalt-zinc-cadmium efflux system membrane fusion protein